MRDDRFVANLRPLVEPLLRRRGLALGICCHPYDLCTELIAREMGVVSKRSNAITPSPFSPWPPPPSMR